MKKLLLSLLTLLTCSIGFASASTVLFDITNCTISENGGPEQGFTGFSTLSSGAVISTPLTINNDITISTNGKYYSNKSGKTIRVYSGNNLEIAGATGIILTNIEINFSNNPFKGNVYTKKEGGNYPTSGTSYNQTNNGTPYTWSAQSSDAINAVKFNHGGSVAYISKITITYEDGQGGGGLKSAGMSFNPTTFSVTVGETLAGPALTTAEGFDGKVVYTSGDETIATVDAETGEVKGVAAGTTTISAKSDATATFDKGSASYTLTVIDPNAPTSASVDLMFECGQKTGTQIGKENMIDIKYMIASKSQSLVASLSGASNLCCGENKSVRFGSYSNGSYKQGALTITLKEAYKITSIDVTITTFKSSNNKAPKDPVWNLDINGHQMVETLIADVNKATTYNIPFETVALADESAANTLTIKSTDAPVDVYSLKINYEPTSTGVNDIIADDANAPVEYYNLQGVRVANPESGLYIRVQGKKATKVLVK